MSGFRDTFTKEDKGENMLDYDESAFYYFAAVVLAIVFLPLAYSFIKALFVEPKDDEVIVTIREKAVKARCRCSICQEKLSSGSQQSPKSRKSRLCSCKRFCHLLIVLTLGYCLFFTILQIAESGQGEIRRFDPFSILEIPQEASDKEIKSAYRKLSLKYHPDKNPNDSLAMGRFMQITKAYEALTDPIAKDNYQKYGNPDGPQPMRPEHQVSILVVFFVILLIVIPGVVLYWMKAASSLDPNGVLVENHMTFFKLLNENMQYKKCAWLIAAAAEFNNMPLRKSDQHELSKLRRDLKELVPPMNAKKTYHPRFIKNLLLIYSHLLRRSLPPVLQEDQKQILERAGSLLETAIEQGFTMGLNPRMKRVGLKTLMMLIEYAQLITQGLVEHESNALMLPHVNDGNLKDIPKDRQSVEKLRSGPLPEKLLKKLSPNQVEDIKAALSYFPRYDVKSELFVPDVTDSTTGGRDVAEGDLVTIKITISRLGSANEAVEAGMVHSQYFPWRKTEKLWLLIADVVSNRVFYLKKISSLDAVIEDTDFKFLAGSKVPPFGIGAGEHTFEVIVKSDSYYGLDVSEKMTFKIVEETKVNKEVFVHEEDQKIDNEPTIAQQWFTGWQQEEKDSDNEELPELAAGVEEAPEDDESDMD